ncbi:MAG: glycosyltransferase family 2 protein [Acidimicrobiia bacterium]
MLNTPVALCIFDRPDLTERVFQAIAQARPRRLFVFADGPRSSVEAELCARALAVTKKVDWDCDVKYDLSDVNLGTRRRFASGVDWVFSEVDEAIVLEDDCVPDPTFFPFCEAMLERYRDDTRVMMVSGSNYLERWKEDRQSYHFSHFGCTYGWASWKRAWQFYDITMAAWGDEEVKARIRDLLADEEVFAVQARRFDRRYADTEGRKSWDLPWTFARLAQAGLAVVPAVNLVTNVGNVDGRGLPPTHPLAKLRISPMLFPLRFQAAATVDRAYDRLHVRRIVEWWDRQAQLAPEPRVPSGAMHRRIARAPRKFLSRALERFGG